MTGANYYFQVRAFEAAARYKAGEPLRLVSESLGYKESTIRVYGQKYFPDHRRPCVAGDERKAKISKLQKDSRANLMRDMYKSGKTLEQVGAAFGVTRERVRQILQKQFEFSRADGGQAVKSFLGVRDKSEKNAQKLAARVARDFAKWGMPTEQLDAISDLPRSDHRHPIRKYECQRKNANVRGIEWCFTFKQWWDIWQGSGKWESRGRGKGYCMARYGDTGPYSEGNVEIITIGQNFSDSYLKTPWDVRFPNARHYKNTNDVGIYPVRRSGCFKGWQIYMNKKYISTIFVRP